MKKLLAVLLLLFVGLGHTQAQEKLTNQSVVEMIELGFGADVVVSKIEHSASAFNTSIEALKDLKAKGVPNAVLAVMVKVSKPEATKAKTGIFVATDSGEVRLMPSVFSGSKTSTLAAFFTSGIASAKITSTIHGIQARHSFKDGACSFLFYFDPAEEGELKTTNWWFQTATSPNEFALIRLEVDAKRSCRTIETGSVNRYAGASTGVKNTLVRSFVVAQEAPGVFRVTPSEPLEAGEYCFYYQGTIPQGGVNNQSVFDFSLEAAPIQAVVPAFVPAVGYITLGQAVDRLPLAEGLLYLGQFGGWNGSKYTKGLYLEPRGGEQDPMAAWGGSPCVEKGMRVPTNEQLQRIVRRKEVAANPCYAFLASYYWSLTADSAEKGWSVQVPSGDWHRLAKEVRAYVRCVQEY